MMFTTVKMIEKLLVTRSRNSKHIRGGVINHNRTIIVAIPTQNQPTTKPHKAKQVRSIIQRND